MKRTPSRERTDDGEDPVKRLAAGEVSFGRAAELANVTVREFTDLVRERDVAWVSSEHTEADLDDL